MNFGPRPAPSLRRMPMDLADIKRPFFVPVEIDLKGYSATMEIHPQRRVLSVCRDTLSDGGSMTYELETFTEPGPLASPVSLSVQILTNSEDKNQQHWSEVLQNLTDWLGKVAAPSVECSVKMDSAPPF